MTDEYKLVTRRGAGTWLVTPTLERIQVEKIGAGQFARVYATIGPRPVVYVIVPDERNDFSKDILEAAWRRSSSRHIPSVERVGDTHNAAVYRMPFYKTPLRRADGDEAWDGMRLLQDCAHEAHMESLVRPRDRDDYVTRMNMVIDCVRRANKGLGKALAAIRDAAHDWSPDFVFEFSPRNLATDAQGRLIMLDPVYNQLKVNELRDAAHRSRMFGQRATW